jgi:beta-lactamase superfamily II metal-dependent hydrolase
MARKADEAEKIREKPKTVAHKRPSSKAPAPFVNRGAASAATRVRVYRQGLGDCILISLPRDGKADFTFLIDCGVAMATANAVAGMRKVVHHIDSTTDHHVDILAITHEHWDHVSGFKQAEDIFRKIAFDEIWLAWTEDPADPLAKKLKKEHADAFTVIERSAAARAASGDIGGGMDLMQIAGMIGASGDRTRGAMKVARALIAPPKEPRYHKPTSSPIDVPGTGARVYVLGPPYDEHSIRQYNPSRKNPETYELALDGSGILAAGVAKALANIDEVRPFAESSRIPMHVAKSMPFFRNNYWGAPGDAFEWRRIDSDWLDSTDQLALMLQKATNNTSLVLALELADQRVLLFAADAQVGNWLSWQDLHWKLADGREVTGPDLLRRTVFYKVGHHGSHNATLRQQGLEMMTSLKTAVIPVDEVVAKKMRWEAMPLASLVEAMDGITGQRTLRTDHSADPREGLKVDPLYFEFEL